MRYRAQRGPRKTPDPATTSTHHHRQLIVTRPPPNGLLRIEKDKNPPYGPLSPPGSASPTISLSPGVCCWDLPRAWSQPGRFLRVSLNGRGPISEAIALCSVSIFFNLLPISPPSFKCSRSSWTDSHQLLASAAASPACASAPSDLDFTSPKPTRRPLTAGWSADLTDRRADRPLHVLSPKLDKLASALDQRRLPCQQLLGHAVD